MMTTFYKYQGTGNDFILIDNRTLSINKNNTQKVAQFCNRRFGIGADGLIFLESSKIADFKMIYFNADGNQSTMCGNGGRCIAAFATFMGIVANETTFEAIDGLHAAKISESNVALQMKDVEHIAINDDFLFIDTGSPHHVQMTHDVTAINVKEKGADIRHSALYSPFGSNVNFVEQTDFNTFNVRTYERGVEDETLSCGTGVTAVAIAMHKLKKTKATQVILKTRGGLLKVTFKFENNQYKDIWLIGEATQVFKGNIAW